MWAYSSPARRHQVGSLQAWACFKWGNFLGSFAGAERPILRLNMDETSVKLASTMKKGYVMIGGRPRRIALRGGPRPSLSLRRSALSLVAFACDDPSVQPSLPHVFVTNEHVLSKGDVEGLRMSCPGNVFVLRRRSSWVNTSLLVEIIELLAEMIRPLLASRTVVLSMDACRTHLNPQVAKACAKAGIFIMFIPALATSCLQPLDVCVFGEYKRVVAEEVERRRLAVATGTLPRSAVVDAYAKCIPAVLESKSWAHAFELTGLRGQASLSSDLKRRLQWGDAELVPSELPSLADLQAIYPRRANVPIEDIFGLVLARELERSRPPVTLRLPPQARLPAGPPLLA